MGRRLGGGNRDEEGFGGGDGEGKGLFFGRVQFASACYA